MTTGSPAAHAEPVPLTPADADAVTAVIAACEEADFGVSLIEAEDIAADWRRPDFDLAEQARGWVAGGVLVGCSEVHRGRMENYVRPDHRGQGTGARMLAWTIEAARRLGEEKVGQTLAVTNTGAIELLTAHGFVPDYESWVLALPAGQEIPPVRLADGYRVRGFVPGVDDRAVYDVVEGAFSEWEGRRDRAFDDWRATTLDRDDFEPWQVRVVDADDGTAVAACLTSVLADTGWVDELAVARPHRGRGLAQVLLADAFATTRVRGASRCELNTDSRTGALGLYERVGMEVVRSYRHHLLHLR